MKFLSPICRRICLGRTDGEPPLFRFPLRFRHSVALRNHAITNLISHNYLSLIYSLTHSLILHSCTLALLHSCTLALSHSRTYSLLHSLLHSRTHPAIHALTHALKNNGENWRWALGTYWSSEWRRWYIIHNRRSSNEALPDFLSIFCPIFICLIHWSCIISCVYHESSSSHLTAPAPVDQLIWHLLLNILHKVSPKFNSTASIIMMLSVELMSSVPKRIKNSMVCIAVETIYG